MCCRSQTDLKNNSYPDVNPVCNVDTVNKRGDRRRPDSDVALQLSSIINIDCVVMIDSALNCRSIRLVDCSHAAVISSL